MVAININIKKNLRTPNEHQLRLSKWNSLSESKSVTRIWNCFVLKDAQSGENCLNLLSEFHLAKHNCSAKSGNFLSW